MAKFRESVRSNCEKRFVTDSLEKYLRQDGRSFDEFRELKIDFGKDWGSCHVTLGETRVVAQVSCEVQQPTTHRLGEGILRLNIELNPIGAPYFEAGRQSDLSVQLNRTLEKCLKDSRAVDLESLCIIAKEKVWAFRVDINVLSHKGNILDCASVAALSALAHFRRPDVSTDGEQTIIHTYAQRDPIPTVIHHYPVCVSYAVFNQGAIVVADPTLLEEDVSEAQLIIGVNAYKELCCLHLGGSAQMLPDIIHQYTLKAATRAKIVVDQIKQALEEDTEARLASKAIGFEHSLRLAVDKSTSPATLASLLDKWTMKRNKKRRSKSKDRHEKMDVDDVRECAVIETLDESSAVLLPKNGDHSTSVWTVTSSEDEADVVVVPSRSKIEAIQIEDSGSSEEDVVVVLNADKKTKKNKKHL